MFNASELLESIDESGGHVSPARSSANNEVRVTDGLNSAPAVKTGYVHSADHLCRLLVMFKIIFQYVDVDIAGQCSRRTGKIAIHAFSSEGKTG